MATDEQVRALGYGLVTRAELDYYGTDSTEIIIAKLQAEQDREGGFDIDLPTVLGNTIRWSGVLFSASQLRRAINIARTRLMQSGPASAGCNAGGRSQPRPKRTAGKGAEPQFERLDAESE